MTYCIVNGKSVPEDQAVLPIADRGFRFGDGVFETIAIHNAVPYQYEWHMERLDRGLSALKIAFDTHILKSQCRELIKKNHVTAGTLRIQVTRGIGSRGYLPDPNHPLAGPCFVIETIQPPARPDEPITLWQSHYQKPSPQALPVHVKLCQGVNSTLARMEAAENDCFDAILCNAQGQVCETSSGNILWAKGERLFTPALSCGVLDGSTRAAIIRLAGAEETVATPDELKEAEEVMICNSTWLVLGVKGLLPDGRQWERHANTQKIRQALLKDRDAYTARHASAW